MMEYKVSKFERYWHGFFEFGILLKGFNGVWETISGFLVLFLSRATFSRLFYFLARRELLENPRDRFLYFVVRSFQHVTPEIKVLAAAYILGHGLLNIFLAIQLYRNRLWAYLVTMSAMVVFMSYQVYRIVLHHSRALTILTIFDVLFLILTWHEYRYQRSLRSPADVRPSPV